VLSFISSRIFNNPEIVLDSIRGKGGHTHIPTNPAGDPVNTNSQKKKREKRKARTSILYHKPTLDIPFGNISTSAWITSPATHI
jgi:hypothetical protein